MDFITTIVVCFYIPVKADFWRRWCWLFR